MNVPDRPGVQPRVFDVVLVEPEIPNNTGNIGRTCVATGCGLHLIHPLGFDVGEKACRRAGLDYWPRLGVQEHPSWEAYYAARKPRLWLFTTKACRPYFEADFRLGDALVFGKETAGLDNRLLSEYPDRTLSMPMVCSERSLNLATAVCAAVYEGIRQLIARRSLGISAAGRLVLPTSENPI